MPWEQAPGQTSRDAEDFAVSMLPYVACEPFTLRIDCQGTVDAACGPPAATTSASAPRGHMWGRVWASFDKLEASKTKAHATVADVDAGRTTAWERLGNRRSRAA